MILQIKSTIGHWLLKHPPPELDPNHLMMIAIIATAATTATFGQLSRGTSAITSSDATNHHDTDKQTVEKDALLNKKIHKNLLLSSSAVYALVSLLSGIFVIGVSQQ